MIGLLALAGCESLTGPEPYRTVPSIAGINSICPATNNGDCIAVGNDFEITVGAGRVYLKGTLPVTADCAWWNGLSVRVTYPDGHTEGAAIHTEYVFYLMRCYAYWRSSSFDLQPGSHHVTVTARMTGVDETDDLIINCPKSGASLSARGVAETPGELPPIVP